MQVTCEAVLDSCANETEDDKENSLYLNLNEITLHNLTLVNALTVNEKYICYRIYSSLLMLDNTNRLLLVHFSSGPLSNINP